MSELAYAIVTAARNEADNLPRLAVALAAQTRLPDVWVIAENGSTDATPEITAALADAYPWVQVLSTGGSGAPVRGAPIVRAIHAALERLEPPPDVVVNVDADVDMEPDFFDRLLGALEREPRLGIASGAQLELRDGSWRQRHLTAGSVWGPVRAYRWACLQDVLPLEARHNWDGIDELKARARGWDTHVVDDLQYRHHRREGERDGSRWAHWRTCGESAHYMGYRPTYAVARSLHHARRHPAALGLAWGYVVSAVRRSPQLADPAARAVIRRKQRLRELPRRRREVLGRL